MNNIHSVAFIAKIKDIQPIKGADKIELATVEGWTSIVQKDIHKISNLVLCITNDAVIPQKFAVDWGVDKYLRSGNRVRTIKLKQVYSEAILIPLIDINNYPPTYKEGQDLQEVFGIYKYEPSTVLEQRPSIPRTWWQKLLGINPNKKYGQRQNPNFPIYHKFPNRKNAPNIFNEEDDIVITRKIHGTNSRYGIVKKSTLFFKDRIKKFLGDEWVDYEFCIGSHNVQKSLNSSSAWKEVSDKLDIEGKLWALSKFLGKGNLGSGLIIYGEIFGQGIQGEKYNYNFTDKQLRLFDIQLNGKYVDHITFVGAAYKLDLDVVEHLYEGKWLQEIQDKFSKSVLIPNSKVYEEGIVVKSKDGNRQKIYKIISQEYTMQSENFGNPDNH